MGSINWNRVLVGGVAAGIFVWVFEGVASTLYMPQMQASLDKLGLKLELTPALWAISVIASVLTGLVLAFFYAATRPRFGAGPKTAVLVALVMWTGGYLLSLMGYEMMGLFPTSMLVLWGAVGLAEMMLAALIAGWIYREA